MAATKDLPVCYSDVAMAYSGQPRQEPRQGGPRGKRATWAQVDLRIFIPGIFYLMHLLLVAVFFYAEHKVCMAVLLWALLEKTALEAISHRRDRKIHFSVAVLTLVRHREDCARAASWTAATGGSHGSGFYVYLYFSIWAHIFSQPPVFVSVLHGGHHHRPHIFSGCRRISVVEI
ncbi:uncharacterized protein LOC124704532 [Lolium rigidum]|uniref:uncharacterized protein LOC124704532 n=1 Tax=Lolium rigidum TaxID=89674 RepID=UPI001F5CE3D1|nr:uncharacterized protein LOC124704532 [Lolium rigidum]